VSSESSGTGAAESSEERIVFLCPNGHKLNGPARLQGKPGKCPHCGVRFRIPVYEEDDLEQEEPLASPESIQEEVEPPEIHDEQDDEDGLEEEIPDEEPAAAPSQGDVFVLPPELEEEDVHPFTRLFATLWHERLHGGVVQLYLDGGAVIEPDWWARGLSLQDYGVFAIQVADGTYVMEAVPWDQIKRVSVRRITELPGGVFDEDEESEVE